MIILLYRTKIAIRQDKMVKQIRLENNQLEMEVNNSQTTKQPT